MGFQASGIELLLFFGSSSLLMHITARVSSKKLIEFLPIVFLRNGHVFLLQVAQYALEAGEGKSATEAVDQCLRYKMGYQVQVALHINCLTTLCILQILGVSDFAPVYLCKMIFICQYCDIFADNSGYILQHYEVIHPSTCSHNDVAVPWRTWTRFF